MRIGITFDTREDYALSEYDNTHADFSTLESIEYIASLLEKKGHSAVLIGSFDKLLARITSRGLGDIDIVFNTAEGLKNRNREGFVPSLLEAIRFPYVGTDAYGLGLTLNKLHTRIIAAHLGIRVARCVEINHESDIPEALGAIGVPCVLKPNLEGCSSGVELIRDESSFIPNASRLLKVYDQTILCEEYIDGTEVVLPIVGNGASARVVGIVEIARRSNEPLGIFTLEDKLSQTCIKRIPNLSEYTKDKLVDHALRIHNYLGCADYNRVDFRIDPKGEAYMLEVNALPEMGEHSGFMLGCSLYGSDPADVLDEIVSCAAARWGI
ncbi:MAG: hypothetical protein GXX89_10775 [Clostridiales bacterium]|jgi:D-alanine-D-alanine ligase|nr:hypothetical protein [Clostridiales bacterium]